MAKRILLLAVALGLVWTTGGCVSMGKYELKEKEANDLGKNLQDLQKKHDELTAENTALKKEVEKLTGDVADLTKGKENLTADNKKLEGILKAKSDEMSKTVTDLRQRIADLENENARLKNEIADLQGSKMEEARKTSKTYEEMLDKMKHEISQGQVTISELKGKLTVNMVDAILFDSGHAEVKQAGRAVLQKIVDILRNIKDKSIRVEGHTDNFHISGSLSRRYPTNWELSAARAVVVTRFFQQQGIDPALLSAVAYGQYRPVAGNDTEEGRAKNRRIEIILIPGETP